MVGGPGARRGTPAELTTAVRASYDAAAGGWASGPGPMYERLAAALIAAAPVPLAGIRVLDLGAGTGAAGRAALAAGAGQVVAADLAVGMLRAAGPALHPVAADAAALPFRAGSFDLVTAAFCLNHLPDPAAALAEARRVGAALAASTFASGWTHPAKDAVDAALRPFGYREPPGTPASAWTRTGWPGGRRRPLQPGAAAHRHRAGRWSPRPSWPPGGWAWPSSPRSCAAWTPRPGPRPGGRPSVPSRRRPARRARARRRWPCRWRWSRRADRVTGPLPASGPAAGPRPSAGRPHTGRPRRPAGRPGRRPGPARLAGRSRRPAHRSTTRPRSTPTGPARPGRRPRRRGLPAAAARAAPGA